MPQPRARIEDYGDGLRIVIPPESRIWSVITATGVAIYGYFWSRWAGAGRGAGTGFFKYLVSAFLLFMIVSHVQGWLWSLLGNEIIHISTRELTLRRDYAGVGYTRRYSMERVGNFHYVFPERKGKNNTVPGGIAFLYRDKTVRFADNLDEAEVTQLLQALRQRAAGLGMSSLVAALGQ